MSKCKSRKKELALIIKIICVFIAILFMPMLLTVILTFVFPTVDSYLLTGFSFYFVCSIAIILIPILLFLSISKKSHRIQDIKKWIRKYKASLLIFVLPVLIIQIALATQASVYVKDIVKGPQEAIMTDAFVDVVYMGKSHNFHLVGNIDGQEISLNLIRDAHSTVSRNVHYDAIKIRYYEHLKEVFDVDLYFYEY